MNIAFPAIFVFLLVLPGFLFRQFCQRREVRTFDNTPFSAAALQALLCAAIVDFVIALAVRAIGYQIRVGDVVRLLVGGATALADLDAQLAWLNRHPLAGPGYFGLTNALALAAALTWRMLVERLGLDRRGTRTASWVRGNAPWHYLFSGLDHPDPQGADGTAIAAIVDFKEASYLYTGILMDYEVNDNGELDRLLLVEAQRRQLHRDRRYDDETDTYIDDPTRFYPIAGDVFVLRYDEIKTLNVTYFSLASETQLASVGAR